MLTRKSIKHSDEYYQSFVEQLLKKVVRAPVAVAATAAVDAVADDAVVPNRAMPTTSAPAAQLLPPHIGAAGMTTAGMPLVANQGSMHGSMGSAASCPAPQTAWNASMHGWACMLPPAEHGASMVPWMLQLQQQQQHEVQQLRNDMARIAHETAVERQMMRMEFTAHQQQLQDCKQQAQAYQQQVQNCQQALLGYQQVQQQVQDYRQQVQGYQQALVAMQGQLAALTTHIGKASAPAMHGHMSTLSGLGLGATQWAPRLPPLSGAATSLLNTELSAPGAASATVIEAASPTAAVLQQGLLPSGGVAGHAVAGRPLQQEGLGSGDLPPVRGVRTGGNQGGLAGRQASGAAAVLHPQRH